MNTRMRSNRRNNDNLFKKRLVLIGAIILIVFLGACQMINSASQPLDSNNTKKYEINIPEGAGYKTIGDILQKNKIIKNATAFNFFVKFSHPNQFQAGYHRLSPSMNLKQITNILQKGGYKSPLLGDTLLVKEGESIKDIVQTINAHPGKYPFTGSGFFRTVTNDSFIQSLANKYPTLLGSAMSARMVRYRLEGYLFPDTYSITKHESPKTLIEQMVNQENNIVKPYISSFRAHNMNVQQGLSLASLIQAESSGKFSDDSKVAGIFLNRIKTGNTLGSDSSTVYAYNKKDASVLTKVELDTEVPYNTRVMHGFMPGPINSPGENAIKAVSAPDMRYMFFVSVTSKVDNQHNVGDMIFYKDIDSFNRGVKKYNPRLV